MIAFPNLWKFLKKARPHFWKIIYFFEFILILFNIFCYILVLWSTFLVLWSWPVIRKTVTTILVLWSIFWLFAFIKNFHYSGLGKLNFIASNITFINVDQVNILRPESARKFQFLGIRIWNYQSSARPQHLDIYRWLGWYSWGLW